MITLEDLKELLQNHEELVDTFWTMFSGGEICGE